MAYTKSITFNGCIDRVNKKNPVIFCNECLETTCIKNKIRRQVEDIESWQTLELTHK